MLEFATGLLLLVGGIVAVGLAMLVVLLVHEAAHALVGALVGFRVVAIQIGTGPCVRSWWFAGVRIAWCRWPLHGFVHVIFRGRRWLRLRIVLLALAGPLSTVALAIGCSAMLEHAHAVRAPDLLLDCLQWATWLLWLMAVSSLLPVPGESHRSDGALAVHALSMRRDEVEQRLANAADAEGQERFLVAFLRGDAAAAAAAVAEMERAHPESCEPLTWKAMLRLAAGDAVGALALHDESAAKLQTWPGTSAGDEHAPPAESARRALAKWLAVNRAFFLVHVGTQPALAEARRLADAWGTIREPASLQRVAVLRTRGLVLLHTGAVAQGLACLHRAIAASEPYWLRALGMTYLAYGHALQGDERRARRWGRRARTLHPQGLLLPLRLRLVDEALAVSQARRAPLPAIR